MDILRTEPTTESRPAVRLPWHKPQLQRLLVAWTTADFAKDGSTEDGATHDWPAGVKK